MARHLEQPGFRIVGDAAEWPLLQRGDQGILHGVLGDRQVARAEGSREGRDHLPRLPAEQMINKCEGIA